MSDTTEPAGGKSQSSPPPEFPAVLLAFAPRSPRPPARRLVPPDGLILGRDLSVFDGGPLHDARMSRRHAELRPAPTGGLLLRDLGSKNGSWLRGARVREATLAPGEAFRLGDALFLVAGPAPAETDPDLVGQSPAIAAVLRSVRLVAPHAYAVLLQGETGTGKEVAARAIHRSSGRTGSFVVVNCAALSEGVLESELFGHAKGAFTGAHESREGLFRAAASGTLMLDEIGEMPLSLQAKLLRAADTGRVRPVGSLTEIDADVRLIAATNADLAARVQSGAFRADLYARLAQWTIALPPLRDRREDVPFLVRHLLATLGEGAAPAGGRGPIAARRSPGEEGPASRGQAVSMESQTVPNSGALRAQAVSEEQQARRAQLVSMGPQASRARQPLGDGVPTLRALDPELAQALLDHPWPLNVRGLRSVLAAAVVACPDNGPLRLTPEVQCALAGQSAVAPPRAETLSSPSGSARLPPARPAPPDAATLVSALAEAGGNIAAAARALGGSRQQLYRWARALGVPLDPRRSGRS